MSQAVAIIYGNTVLRQCTSVGTQGTDDIGYTCVKLAVALLATHVHFIDRLQEPAPMAVEREIVGSPIKNV